MHFSDYNPRILIGHAAYDFITNFLLAGKMAVVSCDVNMVTILRES